MFKLSEEQQEKLHEWYTTPFGEGKGVSYAEEKPPFGVITLEYPSW